jgi:uncharacterized membrane protein
MTKKRKWTNEEVKAFRTEHGTFFYCNKNDANLFIPKAYGIGWTLNWANPYSWVAVLALIFFVFIFKSIK